MLQKKKKKKKKKTGAASESNPPLLRNKEDKMASSLSQGFALCSSRQNYEEPFYVLGWDKILVKLFKRICLSTTINKLNYFKFESGCDCISNFSTWYSVCQIARLPY